MGGAEHVDPNDESREAFDGTSFAFVPSPHHLDEDVVHEGDPWGEVRKGEYPSSATTNPLKLSRDTVHYVIQGSAEDAPPGAPPSCFILSLLGWRKDCQLIHISTTTGELLFRGQQGHDVFRSEGEARAYLTVNLGLRIVNLAKGPALLGCVVAGSKLLVGVVATEEARATLPSGEPIYTAADVKWATVKLGFPAGAKSDAFSKFVTDFQMANLHYYTQPYVDITRPYPSTETQPDWAFVWNKRLIDPFAAVGLQDWCIRLLQGVAIGQSQVAIAPNVAANVVLLTRRWSRHPGTRYNARGIDNTGAPANELECEILLSGNGRWTSYVWRRGSVPIRWTSELGTNAVKVGQATFVVLDKPYEVSHRYFDDLAARFAGWGEDGKAPPISLYSLLHSNPEHGEFKLVEHFRKSLKTVTKNSPNSKLELFDYDWHGTVSQRKKEGKNGLVECVNEFWRLMGGKLAASQSSSGTVENKGTARNVVTVASPLTKKKEKEKVGVFGVMRGLVSQKKLRLQEDGFDLDLTYITPRLIAMGFPSYGAEGFYRNPADEVERFFETRHKGHYRIINLCTEREYDTSTRFGGNFMRYPFDDHNAPTPIGLISRFVADAKAYLAEHPENVLSIHCKAGKGRTGVMISALLMAGVEPGLVPPNSAKAALGFFGAQRTKDGKGVTIPSQRRYIGYYEEMLLKYKGLPPPRDRPIRISKIVIQSSIKCGSAPHVYVSIAEVAKWIYLGYPKPPKLGQQYFQRDTDKVKWDSRDHGAAKQASRYTVFDVAEGSKDGKGPIVLGDVKVTFMSESKVKFLKRADEHLFHFGFNSTFVDLESVRAGTPMRMTKPEIDKACKDEKHKEFRRDLQVEVYFQEVSEAEERAYFAAIGNNSMSPGMEGGMDGCPESPIAQRPGAGVNDEDGADDDDEDDDAEAATEREGDVVTTVDDRQRGLIRLNCVDSLDRTNLASFFMGLQVVAELKRKLLQEPGKPFPLMDKNLDQVRQVLGPDLVGILAEAFVANGDVCSLLYTNTPATHTEAVREMSPRLGKAQSNAVLSVKRRYENTVKDNTRHHGFFAFLGKIQPPSLPPTLLSGPPSCIVSPLPILKSEDPADPSVLLNGNVDSGRPWMVPAAAGDVELLIHMPPSSVEVTQLALQFRCDPSTGDDEVFPHKVEVHCGTALDAMERVLGPIGIPRAQDFGWLVYNLYPRGPVGTTLVKVRCSETLGHFLALGGIRVFGPGGGARPSQPAFVVPVAPRVGFKILSHEGNKTTVALSEQTRLQAVYLKCKSDKIKVSAGSGETMTELSKCSSMSGEDGVHKFVSKVATPTGAGSPRRSVFGASALDKTIVIEAPSTVQVTKVQAMACVPNVHKVPKLAMTLPSKKTTMKTRRRAAIQWLTDDGFKGIGIAVLPEAYIAGVRLTTARPEHQAASVMMSVAEAPIKELTFRSAKSARPMHLEGIVVPTCNEATTLDYHFRKTTKGTVVKFEVQAPPDVKIENLLPAAKVDILIDNHADPGTH
eukprot:TRINITY_DN1788_c0_g2_i3.p1 TRINITY_DN1788_c0_g2~~TRINITY_DN1788_c0_g2_i3.p1  ORF type:complete len:1528 (+),score=609.22 TRINITY_DN1788_c0_g2_i3:74-4585(+)